MLKDRPLRALLAGALVVLVFGVVVWARVPVGAGAYYDDGVYLALGRSLAEGHGYAYANLPGHLPGVKYPPALPLALAATWKLTGGYPDNLAALKSLNAGFYAIAAALTFLLFATGGPVRLLSTAGITAFTYLSVPGLTLSTMLLSEPLFLLMVSATLLATRRVWSRDDPPTWMLLATGVLASAAFLTRSIGVSAVLAVLIVAALRRRWRGLWLALGALLPAFAWLAWMSTASSRIPPVLTGHYGSYVSWYGRGLADVGLRGVEHIARANLLPLVDTLRFVWLPHAPGWTTALLLTLLGGCALVGLRVVWRTNPALPAFICLSLALVFLWPYEPYRFYYVLLPFLTLITIEGAIALVVRFRADFPAWGPLVGSMAVALLAVNTVQYQLRGYAVRTWESSQTIPADAFAPLLEWIRAHTPPSAVIASSLDPYVYWQTGRRAVPSWEFLAAAYAGSGVRDSTRDARLAAGVDTLLSTFHPQYVAVIKSANDPYLALMAYAERHPDRLKKAFEATTRAAAGVIYRVEYPAP